MKRVINMTFALIWGTILLYGIDKNVEANVESSMLTSNGTIEELADEAVLKGDSSKVTDMGETEGISSMVQSWAVSLTKFNPFIPFNLNLKQEEKNVVERSKDLELTGYVKLEENQWGFSLKDKASGKSFWLYSSSIDPNLGYIFCHFDENERILTLQNIITEEYFSIYLEKPKSLDNGSTSFYNFSGNGTGLYSEDVFDLEDDLDDAKND